MVLLIISFYFSLITKSSIKIMRRYPLCTMIFFLPFVAMTICLFGGWLLFLRLLLCFLWIFILLCWHFVLSAGRFNLFWRLFYQGNYFLRPFYFFQRFDVNFLILFKLLFKQPLFNLDFFTFCWFISTIFSPSSSFSKIRLHQHPQVFPIILIFNYNI